MPRHSGFAFEADDAVHQQEGIAMREDVHHLVDVEHRLAAGNVNMCRTMLRI
ncbi:MAG: hypothetical protein R3F13_09255 [Prosthecobacter sp.]